MSRGRDHLINESSETIYCRVYGALAMSGFISRSQVQITACLVENGYEPLTVCPSCKHEHFPHLHRCEVAEILDEFKKEMKAASEQT